MKKKIVRFLQDKQRVLDTLNGLLVLLMLLALIIFWKTKNRLSVYFLIFVGGLMNISNGFRYLDNKKQKNMGQSMILFGIVILLLEVMLWTRL